jgi:hypothetical protein
MRHPTRFAAACVRVVNYLSDLGPIAGLAAPTYFANGKKPGPAEVNRTLLGAKAVVGGGVPISERLSEYSEFNSANPDPVSANSEIDSANPEIDSANPEIDSANPEFNSANPEFDSVNPEVNSGYPEVVSGLGEAESRYWESDSGCRAPINPLIARLITRASLDHLMMARKSSRLLATK